MTIQDWQKQITCDNHIAHEIIVLQIVAYPRVWVLRKYVLSDIVSKILSGEKPLWL